MTVRKNNLLPSEVSKPARRYGLFLQRCGKTGSEKSAEDIVPAERRGRSESSKQGNRLK